MIATPTLKHLANSIIYAAADSRYEDQFFDALNDYMRASGHIEAANAIEKLKVGLPSYEEGLEENTEESFEAGYQEGRSEGEQNGYDNGYNEGWEECQKEGQQ